MPPKRSDAAMVIGNNEDLATEILLRLPAKSVVKFKTVSKQWLSIVWCRRFRQTHAFRQGANPTALGMFLAKPESEFPWRSPYSSCPSRPTNGGIEFLSLNGTDDQILPNTSVFSFFEYTKVNIRSSCNGLLLLGSVSTYRHITPKYDRMYYVFNPTTMEFNDIAIPTYMRSLACVNETLCFDPSKSPHYKILFLRKGFYDLDIEIYSSETGACKWQKVKYLASPNNCIGVPGIFCNGAIYWMSREKTLYFDMDSKGLKEFQLPPQKGTCGMICYFGESRGRLHLVRVDTDLSLPDQCPILDVYEFKNQEWFLKCRVDLDSFAIGIPQIISESSGAYQYAVLGIACNEAGELTMALIVYDLFVAYNLDKDRIKVLCNVMPRGSSFMYDGWRSAYMCIQSLACL